MNLVNRMSILAGIFCAVSSMSFAAETEQKHPEQPGDNAHWAAWGGSANYVWSDDLLRDLGMKKSAAKNSTSKNWLGYPQFKIAQHGGLEFSMRNGHIHQFESAELAINGGFTLKLADGVIDLRKARLQSRKDNPHLMDLISADGKAWFYVDRIMYELIEKHTVLSIPTADVRISPALAKRLGMPEVDGWAIADLQMQIDVFKHPALDKAVQGAPPVWHGAPVPGQPGQIYQVDVFMMATDLQRRGCRNCDGPGGANNGEVVFTPNSTLSNNLSNEGVIIPTILNDPLGTSAAAYTADVPWYGKFSGNFAPHSNDQHPYLIWNLYRIDAQGRIDQIGRSGMKHAFLTTNFSNNQGYACDSSNGSHVLGRACTDLYSVGNNDSTTDLGPRSEVIPATGQWGRCKSVYDSDCNGSSGPSIPSDPYGNRMIVRESQIEAASNPGATYRFESWYVIRDDINIYNSMASRSIAPSWTTVWSAGTHGAFSLGPTINHWVSPTTSNANEKNVELAVAEGHIRVASKVTELNNGTRRFDFAVMNFDFSRAITAGAEPNLEVTSSRGFSQFQIAFDATASTDVIEFSDGDINPANDWTASAVGGFLTWTAPANQSLDWGSMYRFSVTTNGSSNNGVVGLTVANPGAPGAFQVSSFAVGPAVLFANGFE